MGKYKCCCGPCDVNDIPDWNIEGFNKTPWTQYGECCWSRHYTRANMAEGIQLHTQPLYDRTLEVTVEQDFTGWWVRQNWVPNGSPPVGSLYPTPMPNTCWNSYGVVATITYDREQAESSRHELKVQLTDIFVNVHRVYNSCTNEVEYYVRVSPVVRVSNRINTITYSRQTTSVVMDECYESPLGDINNETISGTKTFVPLEPIWATSVQTASLYKYDSYEDIPDTLVVDLTTSPVESIDEECFDLHICKPLFPNPSNICYAPPSYFPPGPYIFLGYLLETTEECTLSRIAIMTTTGGTSWSICDTTEPIPSPTGDIAVIYCTVPCRLPVAGGALGCTGTTGIAFANSSVSFCPPLVYNRIFSAGFVGTGTNQIVRKASCSPLDIIPCDPYIDWWYGAKTYPVTNSFRDLVHTDTYNAYSTTSLCMFPTTFTLQV